MRMHPWQEVFVPRPGSQWGWLRVNRASYGHSECHMTSTTGKICPPWEHFRTAPNPVEMLGRAGLELERRHSSDNDFKVEVKGFS